MGLISGPTCTPGLAVPLPSLVDGLTQEWNNGLVGDALSSLEAGFAAGVSELLDEVPALDRALGQLSSEDAAEYGRKAARNSLAPLVWRALAGHALTTEQARELLGISRQALHKRVVKGTLLGLPGERTTLFPVWQFDAAGQVRPAVVDALRVFRDRLGEEVDPRIVLAWATAPQPELKDESPAAWLEADRDPEPLVRAAERAAEALAR